MFHTMINTVMGTNGFRKIVMGGAVLAGMAGVPTAAFAHHHGFHVDLIVPSPPVIVDAAPPCDPVPAQVWIEPTYSTVCDRQWVEPVYQNVTQRVWVPATTTTQTRRVLVPDQFGWRDVVVYDRFGRPLIRPQQVLISPAHYEDRQINTAVCPGHFEDQVQQQLVCAGHWQDVPRQEMVTAGHWETRVQAAYPVTVVQPASVRVEIPLPF